VEDERRSAGNPHILCHIRSARTQSYLQERGDGTIVSQCSSGLSWPSRYLLHEFVVMPDHFHLIVTPAADVSLEKAGQYIKGGFSFRAKRELAFRFLVWQEKSFTNHRIRDAEDYQRHREYIHQNPVKAGLVKIASAYPYSSAFPGMELDPAPSWLKLSRSAGG
jgi:putative transposase